MLNIFLITRSVFFALLANFGALTLVFASWNINASISAGFSVPSTSIFMVFHSSVLFFCILLGLAELFRPQSRTAHLAFECSWVAVLSLFNIGSAISVTVNGPALLCRQTADWGICASVSLLIPSAWLTSFLAIAYFFVLFLSTVAHTRMHRDIWSQTIYSVAWFGQPSHQPVIEILKSKWVQTGCFEEEDSWNRYLDDIEDTSTRKQRFTPDTASLKAAPWAQGAKIRRGVDSPFTRKEAMQTSSARTSTTLAGATLPIIPPKPQAKDIPRDSPAGSRFIEKFRESRTLSRSETHLQYGTHFITPMSPFPPTIADHDLPIPLPRLSEWVRADGSIIRSESPV
ncbi:hypothetical protein BDQ12DRAFT_288085 [Crucibulum laeve]|uniref:Uncharacterized protein n=1 Tax=Crucibulum laeve TaxID=68775 RepID=A0A5C3MB68_9AGAR|nr:hypothetical protein BDQ12DRAFT_288085 [Crucibulum laeve]